jgi:hypothetical protein
MNSTANRELVLLRAYEQALRSAYAHGAMLTNFSFTLPQSDDVLVFSNGNKAYRMETSDSGYSNEEQSHYDALLQNISQNRFNPFPTLTIPPAFLNDADTILESHFNDISQIARGFIRKNINTSTLPILSRALLSFHEALLCATDALFRIDHAPVAAKLTRAFFPTLLEHTEQLILAARQCKYPQFLTILEQGANHQLRVFLECGQELNAERDFFDHQLQTLVRG